MADKENNTKKPWYKKWWVWLIIAVAVFMVFNLIGNSGDSDSSSSAPSSSESSKTGKATGSKTSSSSSSSNNKVLEYDFDKLKYSDSKSYNLKYSDTSWNAATIKVDKVTFYKLASTYKDSDGNEFNGAVQLHMSVTANRDISSYPCQGTIIVKNEQEEDAAESWDGDISKGVTKSGNVTYFLKDLSDVSGVHSLRFKFDSDYDTDDYDDDNSSHNYDMTINFNS